MGGWSGDDSWSYPDWNIGRKLMEQAEKNKECDSFNGYTSNPQLCKACQRPVTEHKSFMESLQQKKYEEKRLKLLELSGTEIDPPDMIDIGLGYMMPRKQFELLREAILKEHDIAVEQATGKRAVRIF